MASFQAAGVEAWWKEPVAGAGKQKLMRTVVSALVAGGLHLHGWRLAGAERKASVELQWQHLLPLDIQVLSLSTLDLIKLVLLVLVLVAFEPELLWRLPLK